MTTSQSRILDYVYNTGFFFSGPLGAANDGDARMREIKEKVASMDPHKAYYVKRLQNN